MEDKVKEYNPNHPHWIEAGWYIDHTNGGQIIWWPGGIVVPGSIFPIEECTTISRPQLHMLIEFVKKNGILPENMTKPERNEDLKIIHRLIDLLEQKEQK